MPAARELRRFRDLLRARPRATWTDFYRASQQDRRFRSGVSEQASMAPDPKVGGGYYLFVANGSLEMQGETLPASSMVFVESGEDAFEIKAGRNGLEALVMQFPRDDD